MLLLLLFVLFSVDFLYSNVGRRYKFRRCDNDDMKYGIVGVVVVDDDVIAFLVGTLLLLFLSLLLVLVIQDKQCDRLNCGKIVMTDDDDDDDAVLLLLLLFWIL